LESEIKQKKDYKKAFREHYKTLYEGYLKINEDMDADIKARVGEIPNVETDMVMEFLDKFCFTLTSANKPEQIDLKLALKALPSKLDAFNY
jgi:hypothetical protein